MKIAIATFADLPSPPVKGGAVETLIDIICQINEKKKKIDEIHKTNQLAGCYLDN